MKTNKIDKPLIRLTKEKRGRTKIKSIHERRHYNCINTRIIRSYYEITAYITEEPLQENL